MCEKRGITAECEVREAGEVLEPRPASPEGWLERKKGQETWLPLSQREEQPRDLPAAGSKGQRRFINPEGIYSPSLPQAPGDPGSRAGTGGAGSVLPGVTIRGILSPVPGGSPDISFWKPSAQSLAS